MYPGYIRVSVISRQNSGKSADFIEPETQVHAHAMPLHSPKVHAVQENHGDSDETKGNVCDDVFVPGQ
eukprot:1444177-Rhodomonas_salina.1